MPEIDATLLLAAWLTGLAGSGGHCLGMCGGIVGALGVGQRPGIGGFTVLLAAHLGRILSYSAAGAVAGLLGATAITTLFGAHGLVVLRIATAVLIGAIGVQLLLGHALLAPLERAGAIVWRRLAPLLPPLLPPRNAPRALAVGALWGWLPCGLVYAQLSVAAAAGGAAQGALAMASFGLGTSVGLTVVGALLQSLGLARLPRQASGALLVVFGLALLVPLLATGGHHHVH
jgi:sulfite exporter TauE/SafE